MIVNYIWQYMSSSDAADVSLWVAENVTWSVCDAGVYRQPDHIHSDVIHVATTTPVSLYSVDTRKQHVSCVDLYDAFPGSKARYHSYRPTLRLAPLGFPLDDNIVIHDELVTAVYSAVLLLINTLTTFKLKFHGTDMDTDTDTDTDFLADFRARIRPMLFGR